MRHVSESSFEIRTVEVMPESFLIELTGLSKRFFKTGKV